MIGGAIFGGGSLVYAYVSISYFLRIARMVSGFFEFARKKFVFPRQDQKGVGKQQFPDSSRPGNPNSQPKSPFFLFGGKSGGIMGHIPEDRNLRLDAPHPLETETTESSNLSLDGSIIINSFIYERPTSTNSDQPINNIQQSNPLNELRTEQGALSSTLDSSRLDLSQNQQMQIDLSQSSTATQDFIDLSEYFRNLAPRRGFEETIVPAVPGGHSPIPSESSMTAPWQQAGSSPQSALIGNPLIPPLIQQYIDGVHINPPAYLSELPPEGTTFLYFRGRPSQGMNRYAVVAVLGNSRPSLELSVYLAASGQQRAYTIRTSIDLTPVLGNSQSNVARTMEELASVMEDLASILEDYSRVLPQSNTGERRQPTVDAVPMIMWKPDPDDENDLDSCVDYFLWLRRFYTKAEYDEKIQPQLESVSNRITRIQNLNLIGKIYYNKEPSSLGCTYYGNHWNGKKR